MIWNKVENIMLHIITENNDLKNRTFPLPDGVRKFLQNTFFIIR